MEEEQTVKKLPPHEIGAALDDLSINELETRIGLLEAEIVRLREAIGQKASSRSAADAVFKI